MLAGNRKSGVVADYIIKIALIIKKIISLILLFGVLVILLGLKRKVDPVLTPCETIETSYTFYNVHAYGDQILNNAEYYGLNAILSFGYTANVAIKASKYCTYSWNKTYSESSRDINGNTVNNIPIPSTQEYTLTLKVESSCVRDNYLNQNVKFVWTKSVSSLASNASADLGFPTKALCPATLASRSDRADVISIYKRSRRLASGTLVPAAL